MNILLFLIVVGVSYVIVRIGAIAFQLTGLEWSLSKFQALSCFTATGYTTREAELITSNPQRRKIASFLIIFGHAGLVTLIATFANSLNPLTFFPKFTIPFLNLIIPDHFIPWVNLFIIIVLVLIIVKIFTRSNITNKFTNILRSHIIKKSIVQSVSFEELTVSTGGYGISRVDVCERSPVLNKTLSESNLRKFDITILVIERGKEIISNPRANKKILLNDKLICFGKLENIRNSVYPR